MSRVLDDETTGGDDLTVRNRHEMPFFIISSAIAQGTGCQIGPISPIDRKIIIIYISLLQNFIEPVGPIQTEILTRFLA